MKHKILLISALLCAASTGTAMAASSTFQNTCSNITFTYSGNDAAVQATCLTAAGTPNNTKLVIMGISNQNGQLTSGSGASTFQQSCGNIQVSATPSGAMLSAICRTAAGDANATTTPLNGINNNNGNLSY